MNKPNCHSTVPFSNSSAGTPAAKDRLLCAISSLGSVDADDRNSFVVDREWAKECLVKFSPEATDSILVQIFPGNTKGQGWSMYDLPEGWMNKNSVAINGRTYDVVIDYHIKFMHFNKYVTNVGFHVSDNSKHLHKEINTPENQRNLAGKWDRENWPALDKELRGYLKEDWKLACEFEDYFENTGRQYLTLALGYSVNLLVPYTELQDIDKEPGDYVAVGEFLRQCSDALVQMVEE